VVDDVGRSAAALEERLRQRGDGLGRPDVAERVDGRDPHLGPPVLDAFEQDRHRSLRADLAQHLAGKRAPPWRQPPRAPLAELDDPRLLERVPELLRLGR
jgi:hypothetical protein